MKNVSVMLMMVLLTCNAHAGLQQIFGIDAIKKDIHNNNQQIQNMSKDITAKLGVIEGNTTKLGVLENVQAELGVIKGNQLKLQASLDANLTALAGINNKVESTAAGRDVNTNIVNDPKLLWTVIAGLLGVILFLLRDAAATRKWLQNALKSKMEYKQKLEQVRGGKNA